jgi:ABC-2 type transport system permease protein
MNRQHIFAVYFRYFYLLRKGIMQLSDLFYWPLIDIFLWGLTSIWIRSQNDVPNLPLVLMTALIFYQISWRGSVDISTNILQEIWNRNLVNLFSTPLKLSEWIAGSLLFSFFKLLITVLYGTLAVYLLYALNVFTIGWAFLPFTAALLIFGWSLGFIAASAIVYWGHRIESIAWMIGVLFAPFSAVFYPVHILPQWAKTIAWCLPPTYVFEGMRAILNQGTFPVVDFCMSLLLDAVFLALSILLFRCSFAKTRIKGLGRLE